MFRLIYKSRSAPKNDWDLVSDILHVSELNNKQCDITGNLLATDTHFLQVLEGRFEDVNETFMRIVKDPRHDELQLISFGVIESRLFDRWAMRGIGVFHFNKDIEEQLIRKYGDEEGGIKFPLKEWSALAMINDIATVKG